MKGAQRPIRDATKPRRGSEGRRAEAPQRETEAGGTRRLLKIGYAQFHEEIGAGER